MPAFQFRVNPPFAELPRCSALLNGVAKRYHVESHRTTLSIKSVIRGAALYVTPQGRHLVTDDCFLVLNHEQEYALDFQQPWTTETLCPFFQRGLVEQVAHSLATPLSQQLDEIEPDPSVLDFHEHLYPKCGRIAVLLRRIERGLGTSRSCCLWLEEQFYALATALVELRDGVGEEVNEFPGKRPATREELYRRLYRGRDFLTSCYTERVSVAQAAKAAHLSPYHFHRMFKLAFRQTPIRFLQDRRLAAAQRLLVNTDQPVTAICFAVGFESLGAFSWLFRKRFGLSPRQYRALRLGRRN
jgi:AraC family transcriptional regulator